MQVSTFFIALVFSLSPSTVVWGRNLRANVPSLLVKACFTLSGQPLKGNLVKCYDEDFGLDDFIGSGTTDANGCVTIESRDTWYEKPDVYCNVHRKSSDQKCFLGSTTKTKDDVTIPNGYAAYVDLGTKGCLCLDGVAPLWCWA